MKSKEIYMYISRWIGHVAKLYNVNQKVLGAAHAPIALFTRRGQLLLAKRYRSNCPFHQA